MHTPAAHTKSRNASYLIAAAALLGILYYQFLPLLLSVLLTYVFITKTNGLILWLRRRLLPRGAFLRRLLNAHSTNLVSSLLTVGLVLLAVVLLSLGAYHMISGGKIAVMLDRLAMILENTKSTSTLPPALLDLLPGNLAEIKTAFSELVREYGSTLTNISKSGIKSFVHIIIGIVVGTMLSFHRLNHRRVRSQMPAFKAELLRRIDVFQDSFERVFLAQAKISLVNTLLTGLYLYVALPLFGVSLPLRMTVLATVFVLGLVPVAGNLISNTVIVILSLGVSLYVAAASLVFLVVIHKLEYFLNAKIIGAQIESSAWELLLAMVVCERIFGIGGIVIAPVYYAYLKNELKRLRLI